MHHRFISLLAVRQTYFLSSHINVFLAEASPSQVFVLHCSRSLELAGSRRKRTDLWIFFNLSTTDWLHLNEENLRDNFEIIENRSRRAHFIVFMNMFQMDKIIDACGVFLQRKYYLLPLVKGLRR